MIKKERSEGSSAQEIKNKQQPYGRQGFSAHKTFDFPLAAVTAAPTALITLI